MKDKIGRDVPKTETEEVTTKEEDKKTVFGKVKTGHYEVVVEEKEKEIIGGEEEVPTRAKEWFQRYFKKIEREIPEVKAEFLDSLAEGEEKAVARLAGEHKADLERYQADLKSQEQYSITRGDAKKLRKEIESDCDRLVVAEEELRRDLLQEVERWKTPAA